MHRLLLSASGGSLENLSSEDLLWRPVDLESSMTTDLGPRLERLGQVPTVSVDFVRLAALVFFCDRTVKRPRMLRRDLELQVAVSDPDLWSSQGARFEALLGLLTGDRWSLSFARRREPRRRRVAELPGHDICLLFSGGADSACGTLACIREELTPLVVSHTDWDTTTGSQRAVLDALEQELGDRPEQVRWRFARRDVQIGSGEGFGSERSRRSRSLLFLALGAALSASGGAPLCLAENGFTSLNPPLMAESGGALSTRTTHPALLSGLVEALAEVGVDLDLHNRFAELTKGEMFAEVREQLGAERAGALLSTTHSCGKPSQGVPGHSPGTHCGVCLGCLVRRAAFIAADLDDETVYIEQELSGYVRAKYLSAKRPTIYRALQDRLEIGFGEEDVLDLGLPDDHDLGAALDLIRRGLKELEAVKIG
jgi:hypothetical protein